MFILSTTDDKVRNYKPMELLYVEQQSTHSSLTELMYIMQHSLHNDQMGTKDNIIQNCYSHNSSILTESLRSLKRLL